MDENHLNSTSNTNESASDEFWSMYLGAADEEDKFLPSSWEANTGGILTFTGLFAATVAAFLIESYKSLSLDPADHTVFLLQQLLAATANTSAQVSVNVAPVEPFRAASTSRTVNSLWFTSLLISLTCALLSTLIQEWARDYRRDVTRRRTLNDSVRDRAYNHVYVRMGIDRYGMDRAVYLVTALVHLAVLLFAIGLVIFLFPIDTMVASVAIGVFDFLLAAYAVVSVLPLLDSSCPYRTPVTYLCASTVWALLYVAPPTISKRMQKLQLSAANLRETAARSFSDYRTFLTSARFGFIWRYTSRHMMDSKEQLQALLGSLGSLIRDDGWDGAQYVEHIWSDQHFFEQLDQYIGPLLQQGSASKQPFASVHFGVLEALFRSMFVFDDLHPDGHPRDGRSVDRLLSALETVGNASRSGEDARTKLAAQLCLSNMLDHYLRARVSARRRRIQFSDGRGGSRRESEKGYYYLSKDLLDQNMHIHWTPANLVPLHEGSCCNARPTFSVKHEPHEIASNTLTVVASLLDASPAVRDSVEIPHWLDRVHSPLHRGAALGGLLPSEQFTAVLRVAGLGRWMQPHSAFDSPPDAASAHYEYLAGPGRAVLRALGRLALCVNWDEYHGLRGAVSYPTTLRAASMSSALAMQAAMSTGDHGAHISRAESATAPRLLNVIVLRDRDSIAGETSRTTGEGMTTRRNV